MLLTEYAIYIIDATNYLLFAGTIKRKPSMKPNIPLTWMTRQLKEMVEKDGEGDGTEDGGGDSGTLTRRPRSARSDDSTLKRHHSHGLCYLPL